MTTKRLASMLGLGKIKVWEGDLLDTVGKSFYNLRAKKFDGTNFDMNSLKNKVVLVSNIASMCNYAPSNFRVLRELDAKYKGEFQVLAFPSNEVGVKEPLTSKEIKSFLDNERIKMNVMEKTSVNGPQTHEVFRALKKATGTEDIDIAWNFETKFLVAREGYHVERFSNASNLEELIPFIERLVGELEEPKDERYDMLTRSPSSYVNTG